MTTTSTSSTSSTSPTKTYVVTRPNYPDEEVTAAKVEFIAGQNRATFFDTDGSAIASFEGQGIDFRQKATS